MKKITFEIRVRFDGVDSLQEVITENYDELTYYVSPRTNKDFKFGYSLYDKKTGMAICSGKSKQELINKYNEIAEKCAQIRKSKYYEKYIKEYEELKKARR